MNTLIKLYAVHHPGKLVSGNLVNVIKVNRIKQTVLVARRLWCGLVRSPYRWWCLSKMKLNAERNLWWFQLQGNCWPWQTFIPVYLDFPPIEQAPCAQLDFFPIFGHIRFLGGKRTGLPAGSVRGCPNTVIVLLWSHGARAVYGECMFSLPL